MIITFTDMKGEFFAFNLNHLKGISCDQQRITIFPIDTSSTWYAASKAEVENVKKQLKKISENA